MVLRWSWAAGIANCLATAYSEARPMLFCFWRQPTSRPSESSLRTARSWASPAGAPGKRKSRAGLAAKSLQSSNDRGPSAVQRAVETSRFLCSEEVGWNDSLLDLLFRSPRLRSRGLQGKLRCAAFLQSFNYRLPISTAKPATIQHRRKHRRLDLRPLLHKLPKHC